MKAAAAITQCHQNNQDHIQGKTLERFRKQSRKAGRRMHFLIIAIPRLGYYKQSGLLCGLFLFFVHYTCVSRAALFPKTKYAKQRQHTYHFLFFSFQKSGDATHQHYHHDHSPRRVSFILPFYKPALMVYSLINATHSRSAYYIIQSIHKTRYS